MRQLYKIEIFLKNAPTIEFRYLDEHQARDEMRVISLGMEKDMILQLSVSETDYTLSTDDISYAELSKDIVVLDGE